MAVKSVRETINGRTYIVERDADTDELIRRIEAPAGTATLKEQLEDLMRSQSADLHDFNHVIEQAIARGELPAAITELRALETQLYDRFKATYLEWRVL